MYYPQEPKEPSGCAQTIIITRMMLGILLVPLALILGAIFAVVLFFYALSVSPFLALLVIAIGGALVAVVYRWEARRVAREMPPDEH